MLIRSENVGPPPSVRWSTSSAALKRPSTRCWCCRGAEVAPPTSAFVPRPKPRPSSKRRTRSSLVASGEPSYLPALAEVDAPAPTPRADSISPISRSSPSSAPATARRSVRNSRARSRPSSGLRASSSPRGSPRGIDTAAHRDQQGAYRAARARPCRPDSATGSSSSR